jgi:hypothetical protein
LLAGDRQRGFVVTKARASERMSAFGPNANIIVARGVA